MSSSPTSLNTRHALWRRRARQFLESRTKHYLILALVALDVTSILVDLFIALVACDLDKRHEAWVEKSDEVLHPIAVAFSSLFMVELGVSVWAFGWGFFKKWFHCFDAAIIVTSFAVDIATKGLAEEIASFIIILRLLRLVKIIEEVSVGAEERMETLEGRLDKLKRENAALKKDLESARGESRQ